jgi:hypothetical protein
MFGAVKIVNNVKNMHESVLLICPWTVMASTNLRFRGIVSSRNIFSGAVHDSAILHRKTELCDWCTVYTAFDVPICTVLRIISQCSDSEFRGVWAGRQPRKRYRALKMAVSVASAWLLPRLVDSCWWQLSKSANSVVARKTAKTACCATGSQCKNALWEVPAGALPIWWFTPSVGATDHKLWHWH